MSDVSDYHARARALRSKFFPAQAPVVQITREQPRVVEIVRSTYDQVRPIGVVMKRGKHGPFPLAPIFAAHTTFDRAVANMSRHNHKAIVARVAKAHNVSIQTILGRCRRAQTTKARQEAMAQIYVHCHHFSLCQIGEIFNRHHTTVFHAVKKLGVWRGEDQ